MMNKALKYLGLLFLLAGIGILILIYWPLAKEEWQYRQFQSQVSPDVSFGELAEKIVPVSSEFGLVIPQIQINSRVFPIVDDQNPAEYRPLLAQGVAHAKWSVLPNQKGMVFIFAHSADSPLSITRYNAVFYLINKLVKGDQVLIYYQNQEYEYQVIEKKIVSPVKVREVVTNLGEGYLVLQTCHPPGTTLNRLLVISKTIDNPEVRL
ncbi:sortase [Patescibacteria group bacterium]